MTFPFFDKTYFALIQSE